MRKFILLAACILMLFITTSVIYLAFVTVEPSTINITIISLLSVMGYGAAALYYVAFKQWSKY